jgi:hypothetical protein
MNDKKKANVNVHGLRRYIPVDIARQIRKEAGYGCVICGALFTDYEHIEPEFHDAHEHDPNKMTLLCGTHHDDVTFKRISKRKVWQAKKSPKNIIGGRLTRSMYHQKDDPDIILGSNKLSSFDMMICIYDKPILWFEKSDNIEEPIQLCATLIFNDYANHTCISRNRFLSTVGNYDIITTSADINIFNEKRINVLSLSFVGDESVKINSLDINYMGFGISVNTQNEITLKNPNGCIIKFSNVLLQNNKKSINIDRPIGYRDNGIGFRTAISIALDCIIKGYEVISFNGDVVGWIDGDYIINKNHEYVGIVKKSINSGQEINYAHGLDLEFVGIITEIKYQNKVTKSILLINDEYENGEPIWIFPNDRSSRNSKNYHGFDLGHRFFGSTYFP